MRRFLPALLLLLLAGCSRSAPTLAGGKPVAHWVSALRDPSPAVRKEAAFKLGNVGPGDPAALPALLAALRDPDPRVRGEVILALLKSGGRASPALAALEDMERSDPDPQVREAAGRAARKLRGPR